MPAIVHASSLDPFVAHPVEEGHRLRFALNRVHIKRLKKRRSIYLSNRAVKLEATLSGNIHARDERARVGFGLA